MDDKRVEAAAWLIGSVLNYECGGDWDKLNDFAKEHYTRVAKSALELSDAASWQPIETAPRDETIAIFTDGKKVSQGRFDKWDRDFIRHDVAFAGDGYASYYETWKPTHWQPLPAPPSDDTP